MTRIEKKMLAEHAGHEVKIVDYMLGEPIRKSDGDGRFCLECVDCDGAILLGGRTLVGTAHAISVT